MNQIPFSHNYPKLWGQKTGKLVYVQLLDAKDVQKNKDLLEYDTKYDSNLRGLYEYYPLPKSGNLIQLVFIGDKGIPFCTLRPEYSKIGNKLEYYQSRIGQDFEIVMKDDKVAEAIKAVSND